MSKIELDGRKLLGLRTLMSAREEDREISMDQKTVARPRFAGLGLMEGKPNG